MYSRNNIPSNRQKKPQSTKLAPMKYNDSTVYYFVEKNGQQNQILIIHEHAHSVSLFLPITQN